MRHTVSHDWLIEEPKPRNLALDAYQEATGDQDPERFRDLVYEQPIDADDELSRDWPTSSPGAVRRDLAIIFTLIHRRMWTQSAPGVGAEDDAA